MLRRRTTRMLWIICESGTPSFDLLVHPCKQCSNVRLRKGDNLQDSPTHSFSISKMNESNTLDSNLHWPMTIINASGSVDLWLNFSKIFRGPNLRIRTNMAQSRFGVLCSQQSLPFAYFCRYRCIGVFILTEKKSHQHGLFGRSFWKEDSFSGMFTGPIQNNISHTRFSIPIILDQNETLLLRNN